MRRSQSNFRRTHAPLVVTLPAYPRAARSHTSDVLKRRSSSRGICHARCGLIVVFSHALCGLVVLAVSITPGMVSSRSSHTPCVGSLFS